MTALNVASFRHFHNALARRSKRLAGRRDISHEGRAVQLQLVRVWIMR